MGIHERRLTLSRKKSRIGCIDKGFHFLGIHYPPTRTEDNTNVTHANDGSMISSADVHYSNINGGVNHLLNIKRMS